MLQLFYCFNIIVQVLISSFKVIDYNPPVAGQLVPFLASGSSPSQKLLQIDLVFLFRYMVKL